MTVTGTSAEAGDDGQIGRGNRVNGLITPYPPNEPRAAAGKNPVSHVGKIYDVVAREISEALVTTIPEVAAANCLLVSRIGAPVISPALANVRLATKDGVPVTRLQAVVEEVAVHHLSCIPHLIERFVTGTIEVY